jgi:hypothetical protein
MGGVFNKVKLGSTVPVKFSFDGYKVLCRRPKSPHVGVRGLAVFYPARAATPTTPDSLKNLPIIVVDRT